MPRRTTLWRPSRMLQLLTAGLLAPTASSLVAQQPSHETVFQPGGHDGSLGAVASEAIECSTIGRDLLARGGNAVDALVGTTFCVGVVASYHSGIGGGGFALVRDQNGDFEAVDFREAAPAAASTHMYEHNVSASVYGGLAVAAPSEVRGLGYIHSKYGSLPWKTVMQGAIHVARNGFRVSTDLIHYAESAISNQQNFLVENPIWAQDFAPNGTLVEVGDIMTRKRYANTLENIANHGAEWFYGDLAHTIADFVQANDGILTVDDIVNYKVMSRPVKTIHFRGLHLHTVGAPAAGAVCFQILKTLERYDAASLPEGDSSSSQAHRNLTYHRLAEAMRFGYGSRSEMGDPDFLEDVHGFEDRILSDKYIDDIHRRILDSRTQDPGAYVPRNVSLPPDSHGTSHIASADASGMAISLTTTINTLFGSQIMEPSSGIILNNEMDDFSVPGKRNEFGFAPSPANYIKPLKRPLSSISPVIATSPSGALVAVIGAAGGSRIISATAQGIWHIVEHAMSAAHALAMPRLHDQLSPDLLELERGLDDGTRASLEARGHNVTWVRDGQSTMQAIKVRADGVFEAAGEPRQNNSAGLTL